MMKPKLKFYYYKMATRLGGTYHYMVPTLENFDDLPYVEAQRQIVMAGIPLLSCLGAITRLA